MSLSIPWDQRQQSYDTVVIGSGYGGSITAARLAAALPPHSLCILERGKEWEAPHFPSDLAGVVANTRSDINPLGLYELLNYRDISVIKGSGLGGTSLINANVAIVPDEGVFEQAGWPRTITHDSMKDYYKTARTVLDAGPVPGAADLLKVKALQKRASQIGTTADPLNVAVNFRFDNVANAQGVLQKKCTLCGDCVTGCNLLAKNTLPMNYLPLAKKAGADIFVQVKVTYLEKVANNGGWIIHGEVFGNPGDIKLHAKNVILSAGAINSTEILMRSETKGLSVSPALGTGFSGNGDFFGLAFNGDNQTNVLGYGQRVPAAGEAGSPGPSIVGIVRYNGSKPVAERITIEDFSFPSATVNGLVNAKTIFAALRGEDTTAGNEAAQATRLLQDLNPLQPYHPDGALNHTMLYLVMGQDNARGTMNFDQPWFEPDGRMTIEWDQVGQQIIFRRMNEELRRHAQALGANYIQNPLWSAFQAGHLITAHPLGGVPMGEDYLHGAVDEWGRVFAGDGSVHDGLLVADGSLIPSALGVNPFLTISAITERIAERKVKEIQGEAYPKPPVAVSMAGLDPLDIITRNENELEKLFRRSQTLPLERFVNHGGPATIDVAKRRIHNDAYWKGFFPQGHVLNAMSSAIFTGFKKRFFREGNKFVGITNDTDDRITAHNELEEVTIDRKTGTLEPGKYIHLKYLDPQWSGFYDIFKMINEDLLIGRVYLGSYPNGIRVFTFSMSRQYSFAQMTVDDHIALFNAGTVPTAADLQGVWQMDAVSNNNHLAHAAMLAFQTQPDGKLEARYQLMGLLEGLVVPTFFSDHFQLNDFTPLHDEIRKVTDDLFVGRYIAPANVDVATLLRGNDLGIVHVVPGTKNFGVYYVISKTGDKALPTGRLLQPFLDTQVPDGVGLTFDETMVGWYFDGQHTVAGKSGDLEIGKKIPATGTPAGAVEASFNVRMTVRDVNEFVDGDVHEATLKGTIHFGNFQGKANVTYPVNEHASNFNYLILNQASGEAEMRYHIEFAADGASYVLEGRKYMEKNGALPVAGGNAPGNPLGGTRELLDDYTTLFCHISRREANGSLSELGIGYLKFKTFEDLRAVGNLAGFLTSFQVTGIADPLIQLRARMRFIAFTGQFVQREYDPLALPIMNVAAHV